VVKTATLIYALLQMGGVLLFMKIDLTVEGVNIFVVNSYPNTFLTLYEII